MSPLSREVVPEVKVRTILLSRHSDLNHIGYVGSPHSISMIPTGAADSCHKTSTAKLINTSSTPQSTIKR